MCNCGSGNVVFAGAPIGASIINSLPGSAGFYRMQAKIDFAKPIQGFVTGAIYPFHRQKELFVDRRDAAYLLSPEIDLV